MMFQARGPSPLKVTSVGPSSQPARPTAQSAPSPSMSLSALTDALSKLGITLSLRLVVDAPAGAMTPGIKEGLAYHKPALLERLGQLGEIIGKAS